jgi:hypothetical protein
VAAVVSSGDEGLEGGAEFLELSKEPRRMACGVVMLKNTSTRLSQDLLRLG